MKLLIQRSVGAIHNPPAFDRRTFSDLFRPTLHIFIAVRVKEFCRVVHVAQHHVAKPRPDSHIGNGVLIARHVSVMRQLFIQHVQQAFGFHRKAVDRVLNLHWRVVIEVTETTAKEGRCALEPEQPVQGFGTFCPILRQEVAKLFCQIQQDRARLKHAHRRILRMIA